MLTFNELKDIENELKKDLEHRLSAVLDVGHDRLEVRIFVGWTDDKLHISVINWEEIPQSYGSWQYTKSRGFVLEDENAVDANKELLAEVDEIINNPDTKIKKEIR